MLPNAPRLCYISHLIDSKANIAIDRPYRVLYNNIYARNCRKNWKLEMPKQTPIVVTFKLDEELYKKLCQRLTGYGERSIFFRYAVEKFLSGDWKVEIPARTL